MAGALVCGAMVIVLVIRVIIGADSSAKLLKSHFWGAKDVVVP